MHALAASRAAPHAQPRVTGLPGTNATAPTRRGRLGLRNERARSRGRRHDRSARSLVAISTLLARHARGALGEIAGFFGFDAPPRAIEAIAGGPLMQRYSKALEYDYSPSLRGDLIADAATAS